MITLIASVDMRDAIGNIDGNLLFKIPKDMAHFKRETTGKKVVMGRLTWESLPKRPLKNRDNYVLTRNESFKPNGATVLHSVDEVLKLAEDEDVYIIGGEKIYHQLIPHADKMILTHIHEFGYSPATYFPKYSHKEWKLESMDKHELEGLDFTFATYTKKK